MWEFGLQDYWVNEAFTIPGANVCFAKKKTSTKVVSIKLVDLTSPFLILGMGLGLALFSFLVEVVVSKYHHEMKRQKEDVAVYANHRLAGFDEQTKTLKSVIEEEPEIVELK